MYLVRRAVFQRKLENFQIAVFLLSYERGGGLSYSWLH